MDTASWSAPIDAYCERTDASLWSEPLNAASNAAFLLAALALSLRLRRAGPPDRVAAALAGLIGVIGLGSFLFHTLANRWSALADVAPIALFIHAYLFVALRRFLALGAWAALAAVIAFASLARPFEAAAAMFLPAARAALGGSVAYLPAGLAIFAVGGLTLRRARLDGSPGLARAGRELVATGLIFAASLLFRSLDLALCAALPAGTHWLWHVLNAVVLFRLVRIAMEARRDRRAGDASRGVWPARP